MPLFYVSFVGLGLVEVVRLCSCRHFVINVVIVKALSRDLDGIS